MPWQTFLLCSFLCYIINTITLYWSLEQMDMTNKDEDDAIVGAVATSVLAFGVAINVAYNNQSSIPREPYTNKDQEREFYMNSILNGSDVHCIGQIRMSKHVFYELCNALRRNNLLCSTKNMSIQEQVLIFLEIVGFNERFRKIGSHIYRSIESIHRCFHTVLQAVLKLYPILIKPSDGTIQPEIRNNYRYYPWFAVSDILKFQNLNHFMKIVHIINLVVYRTV
uniref:Putative ovule protein n=1 Tax=Solanum chacoense TaxID=4108 RepID=A0A0V0I6W5_SOLCH